MLSLLLGFAQARAKYIPRKRTETQKSAYKVPESLAPFISKDPRYVKVYRPKEFAKPIKNGGGVNKICINLPHIHLYMNDELTRQFVSGCSIATPLCAFIPEAIASKICAAICAIAKESLKYANHGNGVVMRWTYVGDLIPTGIWSQ